MRGTLCAVCITILLLSPRIAGGERLTFDRVHPAPHDLGSGDAVALVYAIGDTESISTFLDVFLHETNHGGLLQVYDARNARRTPRTSVSLRVGEFRCSSRERSGEGSVRDYEGKRIRRRHLWVDATCEARVDIVRGTSSESFRVRGEGTSPRVAALTGEEVEIALDQAARYAGVAAAEQITPRRVRETIALDESAPAFSDGAGLIEAGRLDEARKVWESRLERHRESPALHFNLAAVCEAAGDVRAAKRYFEQAYALAPGETRYRTELEMFHRRNRLRK